MSGTREVHQPGLAWEHSLFDISPIWMTEPALEIVEKIARQSLHCECEVAFLAEGSFNKVYSVNCSKGVFVLRVALPVAPKVKTLSTVATMSFIHAKTSIPVPKVIAYSADVHNELGFEWILMERVNGSPLEEQWSEISWLKKGLLIRKIVGWMSELSDLEFSGIGSVYGGPLNNQLGDTSNTSESHNQNLESQKRLVTDALEALQSYVGAKAELPGAARKALEQFAVAMVTTQGNPKSSEYVVGETVAPAFFMDDHIQHDINRGPYQTSAEYVAAHMAFLHHDIQGWKSSEKASKREDGETAQKLYDKLQLIVPKLFSGTNKEPTFLCHQDLSANNILVDENGDVAGVIDWEAVITAPRWQACKLPQLLNGSDDDNVPEPLDEEQLEDENAVEGYNDSMHDYEQTQLRRFFFEEMGRVNPGWMQSYHEGATRRDVMVAIESVKDGMRVKLVKKWLDCLLEERTPKVTLFDAIMADPWSLPKDWA